MKGKTFTSIGVILFFAGLILLALQILFIFYVDCIHRDSWYDILSSLELMYISLLIIPAGVASFLWFGYKEIKLQDRREVESEEIESLYAEVDMYKSENEKSADLANEERGKLQILQGNRDKINEQRVLPLRRALVDLYPASDLISKLNDELRLLNEYTPDDGSFDERLNKWEKGIKEVIDNMQDNMQDKSKQEEFENYKSDARAQLKSLRQEVAWYDKTWAIGEVYMTMINYWAVVSVIVLVLVGILPVLHPCGDNVISVLHWGALGLSGAILSSIVSNQKVDVNEVGEQDGKQVVSQVIINMGIGAITAVLLYAALLGEILDGKIFPDLPLDKSGNSFWVNTGLSIFWAMVAGFSLNILTGLVSIAENTFKRTGG